MGRTAAGLADRPPFAVLLCVAVVVGLRTVRRTPVDSREA